MEYFKRSYPFLASGLFVIIIVIAHVAAPIEYHWTKHTISHLGAQSYDHAWIMQTGFLTFGIAVALGVLLNGMSLRTLPILIYGACIALTGIYCTDPFVLDIKYDTGEARLHSIFAQVAGFSFTLGILIQMFFAKNKKDKLYHFIFFLAVLTCSALFGLLEENQGIVQRGLYLVSLVWFAFFYRSFA